MKQQTFTDMEYCNRKRKTKCEEFLEAMDQIIPWSDRAEQKISVMLWVKYAHL